ncbi:MAG: hypothetical protein QG670_260 [Thermoproteota archaeon]|nr:hypothetical protein [Thermoproteota archaeon]
MGGHGDVVVGWNVCFPKKSENLERGKFMFSRSRVLVFLFLISVLGFGLCFVGFVSVVGWGDV